MLSKLICWKTSSRSIIFLVYWCYRFFKGSPAAQGSGKHTGYTELDTPAAGISFTRPGTPVTGLGLPFYGKILLECWVRPEKCWINKTVDISFGRLDIPWYTFGYTKGWICQGLDTPYDGRITMQLQNIPKLFELHPEVCKVTTLAYITVHCVPLCVRHCLG